MPYILNQAADATSKSFQLQYQETYGFTQTQWLVLANLGKFGSMTARDMFMISIIEKTKVSRAVAAWQDEGLLQSATGVDDRRTGVLSLTAKGQAAYADLGQRAIEYNQSLRGILSTKGLPRARCQGRPL